MPGGGAGVWNRSERKTLVRMRNFCEAIGLRLKIQRQYGILQIFKRIIRIYFNESFSNN